MNNLTESQQEFQVKDKRISYNKAEHKQSKLKWGIIKAEYKIPLSQVKNKIIQGTRLNQVTMIRP